MFGYLLHPSAEKALHRLPVKDHQRIIRSIKELCVIVHPSRSPNVTRLEGYFEPTYRLRVGDYRVRFIVRKPYLIYIFKIRHRQSGY
jgi:mRNA-degrading endonuclease RelE of RelBE toxin-antitoxin system